MSFQTPQKEANRLRLNQINQNTPTSTTDLSSNQVDSLSIDQVKKLKLELIDSMDKIKSLEQSLFTARINQKIVTSSESQLWELQIAHQQLIQNQIHDNQQLERLTTKHKKLLEDYGLLEATLDKNKHTESSLYQAQQKLLSKLEQESQTHKTNTLKLQREKLDLNRTLSRLKDDDMERRGRAMYRSQSPSKQSRLIQRPFMTLIGDRDTKPDEDFDTDSNIVEIVKMKESLHVDELDNEIKRHLSLIKKLTLDNTILSEEKMELSKLLEDAQQRVIELEEIEMHLGNKSYIEADSFANLNGLTGCDSFGGDDIFAGRNLFETFNEISIMEKEKMDLKTKQMDASSQTDTQPNTKKQDAKKELEIYTENQSILNEFGGVILRASDSLDLNSRLQISQKESMSNLLISRPIGTQSILGKRRRKSMPLPILRTNIAVSITERRSLNIPRQNSEHVISLEFPYIRNLVIVNKNVKQEALDVNLIPSNSTKTLENDITAPNTRLRQITALSLISNDRIIYSALPLNNKVIAKVKQPLNMPEQVLFECIAYTMIGTWVSTQQILINFVSIKNSTDLARILD